MLRPPPPTAVAADSRTDGAPQSARTPAKAALTCKEGVSPPPPPPTIRICVKAASFKARRWTRASCVEVATSAPTGSPSRLQPRATRNPNKLPSETGTAEAERDPVPVGSTGDGAKVTVRQRPRRSEGRRLRWGYGLDGQGRVVSNVQRFI